MRRLEDIEAEADEIALCNQGQNYVHGERKLASLISDLANHIDDLKSTLDDVVSLQLDAAGIDMKPAYEKLRKMIEERTR